MFASGVFVGQGRGRGRERGGGGVERWGRAYISCPPLFPPIKSLVSYITVQNVELSTKRKMDDGGVRKSGVERACDALEPFRRVVRHDFDYASLCSPLFPSKREAKTPCY